MREIKFRIWNDDDDEKEAKMEFVGALDWDYNETIITCNTTTTKLYALSNNHLKIMQYTGLKDKNGKEIYEGDIVRCYGGECYQGIWEYNQTIVIKDITHDCIYLDNSEYSEIIGNIYENPELIK